MKTVQLYVYYLQFVFELVNNYQMNAEVSLSLYMN